MHSFRPSDALVEIVIRGARFCLARAEITQLDSFIDPEADVDLSPARVSNVVAECVDDVLTSLGNRRKYGVLTEDVIANSAGLLPFVSTEFQQSLPMLADDAKTFSGRLVSDIKTYLKEGGSFAGDWGDIVVTSSGDLALLVDHPVEPSYWARARLREPVAER